MGSSRNEPRALVRPGTVISEVFIFYPGSYFIPIPTSIISNSQSAITAAVAHAGSSRYPRCLSHSYSLLKSHSDLTKIPEIAPSLKN